MMNDNEIIVERHIPCEDCGSSDAKCVYKDGHSHCFSCLITKFPGRKYLEDEFTYEYLPWRGVSKESMSFYGVKTKVDAEGTPVSIGYQYPNSAYKVRSLTEKNFYSVGEISKAGLFGRDKFTAGSHKYVVVTEGELDALSYWQVLKVPCVSVQSSGTGLRDCTADREWLSSFERVYLAFDADAPGHDCTRVVAKLFDPSKVYQVRFDRRKDANDYLQHGELDDLRNIFWNAKKYLPVDVVSSLDDFKKILKEQHEDGVPYPFPTLNSMTYGIRTSESVLITAQEGVGKTELMHAIEYGLLKGTNHNVAAIFLEEPKRRHLQALAGIHLQRPVHLPDCEVSDEGTFDAVRDLLQTDGRLHIYPHFGSDDPEVLLDTIRLLVSGHACRYVLLDHLSMVVSGRSEEDERRQLDYISTHLEMMVKELKFSLILVSHVNDHGQTRGSRYISKIADIRIDIDRDVASGDNRAHLRVSKNRFCGRTGPAGVLVFDPVKYIYTEQTDEPSDGLHERHRHSEELQSCDSPSIVPERPRVDVREFAS